VEVAPWFDGVAEERFPYRHSTDADGLVGMVSTWSPVIVSSRREELLGQVHAFARSHPDLAGRASFEVPYTTRVVLCTRSTD
jgi:hypothetical protein